MNKFIPAALVIPGIQIIPTPNALVFKESVMGTYPTIP